VLHIGAEINLQKNKEAITLGCETHKSLLKMCNILQSYYPRCLSSKVKKNGKSNKIMKQQMKCKCCGKKFYEEGNSYYITEEKKTFIKDLLLERLSLRGVVKVSLTWLLGYLKKIWSELPEDLNFRPNLVKKLVQGRYYIKRQACEGDELWSFVQNKDHVHYVWLVQDRETRQIVAVEVGTEVGKQPANFGIKSPKIFVRMPCFIPMIGTVIKRLSPKPNIYMPNINKIPTILKDLTIRSNNVAADWSDKIWLFLNLWKIILLPSNTLFVITIYAAKRNTWLRPHSVALPKKIGGLRWSKKIFSQEAPPSHSS
jgi:transposase-like protein